MTQAMDKSSVARRQLATAIELLFDGRDTVSVYSLAANAWEVIDVLCANAKVSSFSMQARENVPDGRELKRDYINSPYRNFFKHADRDSESNLPPLPDSQVDGVLFMAVEDYIRLKQRSPYQFQVFQLWFVALNPTKLDPTIASEILASTTQAFPGIVGLPRQQQLEQGAKWLRKAAQDGVLLVDPRTERAFD